MSQIRGRSYFYCISSSKTQTGSTHAKRAREPEGDFEGNKYEHGVTRKRNESANTCRIAGVRSTEQSAAYTIKSEESSSKTQTGSTHAKRAREPEGDFEGNKYEHGVTRKRNESANTCRIAGVRSTEQSAAYTIKSEESSSKTQTGIWIPSPSVQTIPA